MTTATAITKKKRTRALIEFLSAIRRAYAIDPQFSHIDKDFAEIKACSEVWPDSRVSICWWHIRDALRKRLAMPRLKVRHYDPAGPALEFDFIDTKFLPPAQIAKRRKKKERIPRSRCV